MSGSQNKSLARGGLGESGDGALAADIRGMIEAAHAAVAATVNAGLTMLYWRIGQRIGAQILKGERAKYGAEIVSSLGRQLAAEYGRSFSEKNLRRMIQFAAVFPEEQIVVSLIRHLSWTHFLALIPLNGPLQRDFYAEMCRVERWSTRTLRKKIDSMLYERTALSKKPEELARIELDAPDDLMDEGEAIEENVDTSPQEVES